MWAAPFTAISSCRFFCFSMAAIESAVSVTCSTREILVYDGINGGWQRQTGHCGGEQVIIAHSTPQRMETTASVTSLLQYATANVSTSYGNSTCLNKDYPHKEQSDICITSLLQSIAICYSANVFFGNSTCLNKDYRHKYQSGNRQTGKLQEHYQSHMRHEHTETLPHTFTPTGIKIQGQAK